MYSDQFGYYTTTDNRKFYNKLECILHCKSRNLEFDWHFNDQYYDCMDWAVEPSASIAELYAQRARELREKYDYLVLHLSGGNDSGNILETFMLNDIRLDEVFTRGPYGDTNLDFNDRSAANTFAEIPLHCIPIAKYAKENFQPDLRINVMETKQAVVDLWRQPVNWFELGINDLDPGQIFRGAPHLVEPRYQQLTDQGKTVGHIFGLDKPKFYVRGNDFFTMFDDLTLGRCIPFYDKNNNISLIENFYWGPTTGQIVCKQSHMILRQLNKAPDPSYSARKFMMIASQREVQDWVSSIIYPNRILPVWNCEKTEHPVIKSWHSWFFKDSQADFLQKWKSHMDSINAGTPIKWLRRPDLYQGYKTKYAKGRKIGTLQVNTQEKQHETIRTP
jgi:hypothetical protein